MTAYDYGMSRLEELGLGKDTLAMLKRHRVLGGRKVGGGEFRVLIDGG
jgi:hypothetical protein